MRSKTATIIGLILIALALWVGNLKAECYCADGSPCTCIAGQCFCADHSQPLKVGTPGGSLHQFLLTGFHPTQSYAPQQQSYAQPQSQCRWTGSGWDCSGQQQRRRFSLFGR